MLKYICGYIVSVCNRYDFYEVIVAGDFNISLIVT